MTEVTQNTHTHARVTEQNMKVAMERERVPLDVQKEHWLIA